MRNHGSIRLVRETIFGGKLGSGYFGLFLFCFCLARGERVTGTKDLVIKKGTTSCVASHSFLSFLSCLWQFCMFIQTLLGPKTFLYISLVLFWSWSGIFFFFCFLLIFDRELSFPFAFFRPLAENFLFILLLKHICSLIVNGSSFLGGPFVPSFEGKGKNSYPRSRFMADELRFWLKRLVEGQTWGMSRIFIRQAVQG